MADVASGLAYELKQIEFAEIALADFAQVMSDLSAIPVTLDLDALAQANLSPETPIRIRQVDTTVEQVLSAALRPLGLDHATGVGHLTVTSPAARSGDLRQITYDVADLAQGDAEGLAALERLILELAAPDSWMAAGGPGVLKAGEQSLVVRQSPAVHFRALQLLEKLRVARGLEPRSGYSSSFFRLESRRAQALAVLNAPVSFNFSEPRRLQQILERLGEAASARILVDWQAAYEVGWSTEAEATLVVDGQPLAVALERLLGPMELSWRIVDEATLQVTTPRMQASRVELEFYPVGDLVNDQGGADELLQRLRNHLGEGAFRGAGGDGVLRFDAESRCLLAALNQPQQIALARFLDKQRERK
jgi:hypothetical protein